MAGFVAEKLKNGSHYLIFFDNGRAGYVPHDECYSFPKSQADEAIREISDKCPYYGAFLQKFFEKGGSKRSLRVKKGTEIHFLHENKMVRGKVIDHHHSLIQVVLPKKSNSTTAESQWLYRGSWLIRDIFLDLFPNDSLSMSKPLQVKQKKKRATHKITVVTGPSPMRKKTTAKEKKVSKKTMSKTTSRAPEPQIIYLSSGDDDSDFTDCSSQSTDQEQVSVRKKTFVKTKSTVQPDRTILQRRTNFPIRVPLLSDSARERLVPPVHYYEPHHCSAECLPISSRTETDSVNHFLGRENPYAIPLILGWSREIRTTEFVTRTTREADADVYYRSPCGKSISSAEELHRHLSCTKSAIPIDLFAFDADLEVHFPQKEIGCFYYDEDLSHGVEETPVTVVNELEDRGPDPFTYTKHFTLDPNTRYRNIVAKKRYEPAHEAPFDPSFLSCCSCTDNCSDPMKCECQALTRDAGRIIYPCHDDNYSSYAYRRLGTVIHTGVFECNPGCPCDNSCLNRLIQLKNRNRLQIFKTGHHKGWGIRTLHDIPKGTFLCQYVARILTPEQGNDGDHDDTYFADLDHIRLMEANKRYHKEHPEDFIEEDDDSEEIIRLKREMQQGIEFMSLLEKFGEYGTYVVDAMSEGNIGRFFNHSCDPNCEVQNVFYHTHDPRFPCICLFTTRTVKAMEELVWDYGYEVDSVEGRKMWCKCGSRKCRKRLL
jgi:hypothetical protein